MLPAIEIRHKHRQLMTERRNSHFEVKRIVFVRPEEAFENVFVPKIF